MSFSFAASKVWLLDTFERLAKTFGQTFGATLIASGWFQVNAVTNTSILQRAGVAGLAAVLSVVSSIVSKYTGDPNSASLVA